MKNPLNKTDWWKVAKGAGVAVAGAVLTYVSAWMAETDFGSATPAVVAVWSVVANAVRKWLFPSA